jgi:phosphoglycerate dehydrogenase-like enzyme
VKIAILDDYQDVAREVADWGALAGGATVTFFHDTLADEDALVARLAPFAIIGAMRERTPFPDSVLARLPNLRLIVTTGMKNAAIDVAAANRRGVTVCGTGSSAHSTAELAFALVLVLARDLVAQAASMRAGGWQVGLGHDVHGKTLGLIGLGRLGGAVARMAQAFGMTVIAWSENLTDARCAELGAERVSKDELLARADFTSIHLRLSDRTRGLIGAAELARMRPTASLINTSRAPIVDTHALVAALLAGTLRSAALDVYDIEPLPADSPLRGVPNLLLTPHVGYVTRETYEIFYPQMVEAIAAFLAGKPVRIISD